jgi:hypothetical protein
MKKKKAGRPPLPKGLVKKRFNVRLSERQQKILLFNEGTESPQKALDSLIEQKERTLKVINNQFWKTLQNA